MKVHLGNFKGDGSKRKIKIKIDEWDTWSMDHTLAMIIVPLLKQLRKTTHGYPSDFAHDDDEYISGQMKFKGKGWEYPEDWGFDEWKRVLSEMIWAFEQLNTDNWMDEYRTGKADWKFKKIKHKHGKKKGKTRAYEMVEGKKHTLVTDYEGIRRHEARMQDGFALFAKYFRALWD